MSRQLSRNERNSWYVPGKTNVEKQHVNEHETLQILQRHALNNNHEEFYNVLNNINGEEKIITRESGSSALPILDTMTIPFYVAE